MTSRHNSSLGIEVADFYKEYEYNEEDDGFKKESSMIEVKT